MKRFALALLALVLLACPILSAQTNQTVSNLAKENPSTNAGKDNQSWLFPRDFVRGWIDFAVAPPHNEPDLSRCNPFVNPCAAFARYVLSGYIEFQPFARGPLKHLYAFFQPTTYFGHNFPQQEYTASMDPIAMERILGAGFELPKNFELRITSHKTTSFGQYSKTLSPTDSGPDKPLGIYNTISVRWYFGGYGRRTHSW
jgi:hypothetical protein